MFLIGLFDFRFETRMNKIIDNEVNDECEREAGSVIKT